MINVFFLQKRELFLKNLSPRDFRCALDPVHKYLAWASRFAETRII